MYVGMHSRFPLHVRKGAQASLKLKPENT